ncbi:hypothetical protein HPB50_022951 [Hyalomma asiaticum]|uniref:Uncharacterized protein n=1 Tax=Hyalomma asiaticum TaxID=266040 RepID=A0ACB7S7Q7_HYAAI|nr:hypothetical protein HPB50_022951 [Hyalomma asiaticum]
MTRKGSCLHFVSCTAGLSEAYPSKLGISRETRPATSAASAANEKADATQSHAAAKAAAGHRGLAEGAPPRCLRGEVHGGELCENRNCDPETALRRKV